jgi:hypothetical protein
MRVYARQHLGEWGRRPPPQPSGPAEALDDAPAEPTGPRPDREVGGLTPIHRFAESRTARHDSHRGRLLCKERQTYALSQVPPTTPISWARARLKPVAKPSSALAPNRPACSGRYGGPTPSSPSAAATSTDASKTMGRHGAPDSQLSCRAPNQLYICHPERIIKDLVFAAWTMEVFAPAFDRNCRAFGHLRSVGHLFTSA